ncbi:MAG: acyl carrier protein [Myxococcales bacterium FL481]|nr:MAG: acyl carrier protein [Myxococcales bacterium FL481]
MTPKLPVSLSRQVLLDYLQQHARSDLTGLRDDAELFSSGTIDSFAMVELLAFLEEQTGARLGPEDISIDNFDTVERILAFAAARSQQK